MVTRQSSKLSIRVRVLASVQINCGIGIVVVCRLIAILPFELLCKILNSKDDEQLSIKQKIKRLFQSNKKT